MTDFGLFVVTVIYGALLVNHARELRRLRNELDALRQETP